METPQFRTLMSAKGYSIQIVNPKGEIIEYPIPIEVGQLIKMISLERDHYRNELNKIIKSN